MKINLNRSIGWNIEYNQYIKKIRMSYNGANNFNPMPGKVYMEQTIITDGADCYPWTETFVIWPRRSVSGAPLFWTKAYKRKVWVVWGTGFHMEPETQYATAFDLLQNDNP